MRQSKMSVFAIVAVIALTLIPSAPARPAQAQSTGWHQPPASSLAEASLRPWIAFRARKHTPAELCRTRRCRQQEWRKHHPLPSLPPNTTEASWYAPGGLTACGGEYYASMRGVAHKTLPCGTEVRICYEPGGPPTRRCVTVPVVDRGPYVAGRELDLQLATKEALGFPDTGTVRWGVVKLPS